MPEPLDPEQAASGTVDLIGDLRAAVEEVFDDLEREASQRVLPRLAECDAPNGGRQARCARLHSRRHHGGGVGGGNP